jgi:hypothetical protein
MTTAETRPDEGAASGSTHASYARLGPPHTPCWGCVMPSVCPFPKACVVYAVGTAALARAGAA